MSWHKCKPRRELGNPMEDDCPICYDIPHEEVSHVCRCVYCDEPLGILQEETEEDLIESMGRYCLCESHNCQQWEEC